MSKIITKRQLNTLIESTLKEYNPYNDTFGMENLYSNNNSYMSVCEDPKNKEYDEAHCVRWREKQENVKTESEDSYMSYMNESPMCECGGMMYEGVCEECGSTGEHMEEELHGNQYKLDKNKNNKIDSEDFEMLRKEGSVEMSVNGLAESVTNTIDTRFLTENMDNFKKLINYKNK